MNNFNKIDLKDLKVNTEYVFPNLQCKLQQQESILSSNGSIVYSGGNLFDFKTDNKIYRFEILERQDMQRVRDFLNRGFCNLAELITLFSKDTKSDGKFSLHVVFFATKQRFGKLPIIITDKVNQKLVEKKFLRDGDKNFSQLASNFYINDEGNDNYAFAYVKGRGEEINGDLEKNLDEDSKNSEDDSADRENNLKTSSVEDLNKKNQESLKGLLRLYGRDFTLVVNIIGQGDETKAIADKVIFVRKNLPCFHLGIGKLDFNDQKSFISQQVTRLLKSNSNYLDVWDKYADKEGEFLLKKAREIGTIGYENTINQYISKNKEEGFILNIKKGSRDKLKFLNTRDQLIISEDMPIYLEDQDMTWKKYRDYTLNKPAKTSNSNFKYDNSENKDEDKIVCNQVEAVKNPVFTNKIKQKQSSFDILEINENLGTIVLKGAPAEGQLHGYLFLSIYGDQRQIERRENARERILNGTSANPLLGLIIGSNSDDIDVQKGNLLGDGVAPVAKVKPLTDAVKNKIFEYDPTDTQLRAIDIALNTPDIAIIQGPPGTGKTTIITAILERLNELSDKTKFCRGQVLVTSLQHDAVENVIQRITINSLPTIKFGKRRDEDDNFDKSIDEWCETLIDKVKSNNPELTNTVEQKKLFNLFNLYNLNPSDENAIGFLNCARKMTIRHEIINKIDNILSELSKPSFDKTPDIVHFIRSLRTSEIGFADDGANNALKLSALLSDILDENSSENSNIFSLLNSVAMAKDGKISSKQLQELTQLKQTLLKDCIPKPIYKIEIPRVDITEIYNIVKGNLIKPDTEVGNILYDYLNEMENDPVNIKNSIGAYCFAFAATAQQSESKEILAAKGSDDSSSQEYDTVIVDEAARVNPGDLMIPLSHAKKRIILVGDHRQLPHMYDEEIFESLLEQGQQIGINDIKMSMFEHLMNKAKLLEMHDGVKRTITLDAQYRMHPLLGRFINDNFYGPHKEDFKSPLPDKLFQQELVASPVLWVNIPKREGEEKRIGTSRQRRCEASYIARKINEFSHSKNGKGLSFGVITFYSSQVGAIKAELAKYGLKDKVLVGSVDAFQGREFDVIFLSIVRTLSNLRNIDWDELNFDASNLPENDNKRIKYQKYIERIGIINYGFLTSENRLCVALSRQKKLLVVVGDGDIFNDSKSCIVAEKCLPALKNLYDLCRRKGFIENA